MFLDKDGTLIKNLPYNVDVKKITFFRDVWEGLKMLSGASYRLIVVTNQPGPAYGFYTIKDIEKVKKFVLKRMLRRRIKLWGYYYCPHHPGGTVKKFKLSCGCRKPLPGLIQKAGRKLNVDLTRSWMIGDTLDDIEAGKRSGCSTVLINNGNETEWKMPLGRVPDAIVSGFLEAARFIRKNQTP